MFLFTFVYQSFSRRPPADAFINDIHGKWNGQLVRAEPNEDPFFTRVSVSFSTELERHFSTISITSTSSDIDEQLFFQVDEENPNRDTLNLSDRYGDTIGQLRVFDDGQTVYLRGKISPKNEYHTTGQVLLRN